MSHVDKVKQLLNDGEYHCAKEFEAFSWSKHKRIGEAEIKFGIKIVDRPCGHGISGAKDYKIEGWKPPVSYRPMTAQEEAIAKQNWLFK